MPFARLVSSLKIKDQIYGYLKQFPDGRSSKDIFKEQLGNNRVGRELADDILIACLAEDSRFVFGEDRHWTLRKRKRPTGAIWDRTYVAFDLEATGSHPVNHRLMEIGAVRIVNGEFRETYSRLVNPERKIPPYVRDMTGINANMVRNAPLAREVLPDFLEFVGDSVLVAHNCVFDRRFLRASYAREFHRTFYNDSICTLRLSKRLLKDEMKKFGLDPLCEFFGITLEDRHRALGDAVGCGKLFLRLLEKLQERGASTLAHVLDYEERGTFPGMIVVDPPQTEEPPPAGEAPSAAP